MNALSLLLLQTLWDASAGEAEFPRLSDPEPAQEVHKGVFPWFGVGARMVWTSFDEKLRIGDAPGFGLDATLTLDYGSKAFLGFRAGYLGWNTETDDDVPGKDSVQVRQYRFGVFGEFSVRFLEIGIGANVGAYRFRREKDNDTAAYFEFEGRFGVRPHPQFWAGVVGMQTMTGTDFNRSSHHFVINYSIGPAVEFRF